MNIEINNIESAGISEDEINKVNGRKRIESELASIRDENGISSDMLDRSLAIIAEGLMTGQSNLRSLIYCVIRDAIKQPNPSDNGTPASGGPGSSRC